MGKLEYIRSAGKIVAAILKQLKEEVKPGICGKDLEKIACELMKKNNVYSSSLGYNGFPAAICVSVNNELTHGIPNEKPFQEGDLVSMDVSCYHKDDKENTYHADAALTTIVGEGDEAKKSLLNITKNSLYYVIQKIIPNKTTTQNIGSMLEKYIRNHGYKKYFLIKEYGGHGIGEKLHEEPFIPNYKTSNKGEIIREGMFICIEPLVQIGDDEITELTVSPSNWKVVVSKNGYLNAHFEHTIYINKTHAEILTNYDK